MTVLTERGERIVGYLWPPQREDPASVAVAQAGADELDAIEVMMEDVRRSAWPHKADDTNGLLGLHEKMLGLPVKPAGVPLATRQAAVKAAVQSRRVGSAKRWVRRMEALLRGVNWSYQRNFPGPGQIEITIPFAADSYSAAQVQALAEKITPAHLEVIMRYESGTASGWIAGVSRAGADAV